MFTDDAASDAVPARSPGTDLAGNDPDHGESPEEALRRIVGHLDAEDRWMSVGEHRSRWGTADVCRVRPGRVLHVIGARPMASRLRELVASQAAPGWELHPVPPGRTPLRLLAAPLLTVSGGERSYNLLARSGFATVEEVAATPDRCLLLLRQCGPKMVAAVRRVLHDLGWDSPAFAYASMTDLVAARRAHIISRLAVAQLVRYREFAGMLARSSMPLAAVDKIVESLNSEAVPTADQLVCLLLDTAGETEIASYYQATHSQPPAPDR